LIRKTERDQSSLSRCTLRSASHSTRPLVVRHMRRRGGGRRWSHMGRRPMVHGHLRCGPSSRVNQARTPLLPIIAARRKQGTAPRHQRPSGASSRRSGSPLGALAECCCSSTPEATVGLSLVPAFVAERQRRC
jgi:hypothetical protein